jgi:hypothetical protein
MLNFTTAEGERENKTVYNIFVSYKIDNVCLKDIAICPYP